MLHDWSASDLLGAVICTAVFVGAVVGCICFSWGRNLGKVEQFTETNTKEDA